MNSTLDRSGELPTARGPNTGDRDREAERFSLAVVEGPDAGLVRTLDPACPARVLVGKAPQCTVRLRDPHVSRRHASIRASAGSLVLSDLGSTNGTIVNGVAVREASLTGGEAIRLGRTVITVMRGAPDDARFAGETSFGRILGASVAMRRLYPVLHALAPKDVPVLLEGEPGTGKRLVAEELHRRSGRRGPFVVARGDALQEHLACDGGSIFIDELTALSLPVQEALARRLEQPAPDGTRVFFATTRDLEAERAERRVAEALIARLAPTRIALAPLRHREGDALFLANAFWAELASKEEGRGGEWLPADFGVRFEHYPWPGNVRELARAVALRFEQGAFGHWRAPGDGVPLPDFVGAVVERELALPDARKLVVEELDRRYVRHMVDRYGNTRDAARASGVGVRCFQQLRARCED